MVNILDQITSEINIDFFKTFTFLNINDIVHCVKIWVKKKPFDQEG